MEPKIHVTVGERHCSMRKNVQTYLPFDSYIFTKELLKIVESKILPQAVFEILPGSHQYGCM